MDILTRKLNLATQGDGDVLDLTPELADFVARSGVRQGLLTVFVPGSTAAVTTIEHESGVLDDLKAALERLAPKGIPYAHDRRWGDGNGFSHVRAALIGPSLAIPVADGQLALGTWQQAVLVDLDNRPRRRQVLLQLLGQAA